MTMTDTNLIAPPEPSFRKLATIRRIDKLEPIEGADKILKATVGGWELVTAKDNGFSEGDLIVYLEIDSWVPTEVADFLSKGKEPREFNGVKGERLKTIRLRGQLSQGLILPIPDYIVQGAGSELVEGLDLTESLGIQKWEKPVPAALAGKMRGNFPSFIRKTDQERCQNLKREIFEKNIDTAYEITVKMDGSSMTVYCKTEWEFAVPAPYFVESKVGVCSRNLDLVLDQEGNAFVDTANKIGLLQVLEAYCKENYRSLAVQGELCGPGIQGNKDGLSELQYFVYDIYDIDAGKYLPPRERVTLFLELQGRAGVPLGFRHVPVLSHELSLPALLPALDIPALLKFAEGKSQFNPQAEREGVVFKSTDGNFSFKAISNNFFENGGEVLPAQNYWI